LESIEVYTTGDNVRLQEVFLKMQEHETAIPLADAKSTDNGVIKKYFKSIFPEFDEERVYVSDMKKMLKWYELLKANDLIHFEEETEEAAAEEEPTPEQTPAAAPIAEIKTSEAHVADEVVAEKPKKAPKKKAAEAAEGEEKPAPKPRKKKTEE
jgi:hypothetical protein